MSRSEEVTVSDRAKPWRYDEEGRRVWGTDSDGDFLVAEYVQPAHGRLITAAPTLARALCRVEWNVWGDCDLLCPCCYAPRLRGHAPTCYLDAALTAAGLSAEDREEVRRGQEA